MKKIVLFIVAIFALFAMIAVPSVSAVPCNCGDICVNETGWWCEGGAFNPSGTPIQAAIDNATAGETICVKDGIYNENVDVSKRLTIQSENGSASTIVQASNPADHVFEVTADYVNVIGFKVIGATRAAKVGIYLDSVNYCNILANNVSNNGDGIHLDSSSKNRITNNSVLNTKNGLGILLDSSSSNTISNNYASNNGRGIHLDSSSNNMVFNNYALDNSYGDGICVWYSSNNNLLTNNYFNNTNNAYDDGINTWNIAKTTGTNITGGPYLGGNYWSDYTGTDSDGDGMGDTPYDILGGTNKDYLPLTISQLPVSKEMALQILMEDIIKPSASSDPIGAYMLSEPLQQGDVVSSESGQEYVIANATWFIFINDGPCAMFVHPVWYVFMNAATGNYTIVDETWPPMINDESMWDTKTLGRGELIEIYSILSEPVPIVGSKTTAPLGDYGDAPDGQEAYYGVNGSFPTLFYTANGKFGQPGAHTLNVGQEMLGINVSAEVDANDPDDPDGVPNLVDADSDERMFVIIENTTAKLAFDTTVNASAPDVTRYVNVLIDFDQSGNWSGSANGTEWAVVNMGVNVSSGTTKTIITQSFSWGLNNVSPVWMRVSLTREQVNEKLFGADGWDGSGQFEYGEIEDFFVFLTDCPPTPDFAPWWPPVPAGNPPPPPPLPQKPGPEKGPCGYDINYYAIIINGGDHKGQTMMEKGAERMKNVFNEQKYTLIANLGPGHNSKAAIGGAFKTLKNNVNCGDHVTIFINGHGYPKDPKKYPKYPKGGIALKNQRGKTQEVLTPKNLTDFLKGIEACPKEKCTEPQKCCYVTVIIESCFSGNFNVGDVTGQGRIIIGTASNQCSWGNQATGGMYTVGFDNDLRSKKADLNKDGAVNISEAHKSAKDKVDKWIAKSRNYRREYCKRHNNPPSWCAEQKPWINDSVCECVCPCNTSINETKWVWDEQDKQWVDEIDAFRGQLVRFKCQIVNDGKCRNVTNITMLDFLPDCLDYSNNATIYRNGEEIGPREPDWIEEGEKYSVLGWDLGEMGELAPEDSISIEYDATTVYLGENINLMNGSAHCTYDPGVIVYDEDTATVNVIPVAEKSDLVITEKWVYNCTICYNVTNIGNKAAPSCHNTTLYVDGVAVAHDHVPVDIAPGEGYVGCFDGYTWTYTPPSDNITVCADNYETLVELDEDNNCVTNIWMCGDVNCDGGVTMSDVRKVFNRYLDPNYPLDLTWAADVNCDEKVTMSDVRKVFNRYLDPGYDLKCCCEEVE